METKHNNLNTLLFVIDSNFRIVSSNDEFKKVFPEEMQDRHCYELFSNTHRQCQRCPLNNETQGTSIVYSVPLKEWVTVSSAPFDFPGVGPCHIIMANVLKSDKKGFYYNAANTSDYDELLELNYTTDSYNIAYHGEHQYTSEAPDGKIREAVQQLAETRLHPDDRKKFYNFWLLDKVGTDGVPKDLFTSRHGEFRRLMPDGSYRWVQQIMVPVRQNSENSIFVNIFYNVIDNPSLKIKNVEPLLDQPLYTKEFFFKNVDDVLKQSDNTNHWSMLAIDIEKFKLFNEWYGEAAADAILTDFFTLFKDYQDNQDCIAGYLGNDDFALFTSHDEEKIQKIYQDISSILNIHGDKMNVLPALGVYEITDHNVPAFRAYDRANLACTAAKETYSERIKKFDKRMLEELKSEFLLLSDIQEAFKNEEFTFYLQPRCDMRTGKIVGAEALARWESSKNGMISPGIFVPFLEKSGFIAELDTYIWEEVCKWQRKMLDRGIHAIPVSVNVSRTDLYSIDVPKYFCNLIKKYDLDPEIIEIEITESAYAKDNRRVNQAVTKLRNAGFHVLMDDFGSAYSSLNMLKDIAVDTLKVDMRFLDLNEDNTSKGIDILRTVCNMANILGLNIVVEGIETEKQKDYLLTMKCCYGQGYYFYRPLSVSDFEKELECNQKLNIENIADEKFERLYLKDLLGDDIFSETMLNNMLGAVVFYDVYQNEINILRYNEQYSSIVGNYRFSSDTQIRFGKQLYLEDYDKLFQMFENAKNNRHLGADVDLKRRKPDGSDMWIHLKTFFLHTQNGHSIYYSSVSDVTPLHKTNETLKFFNNDMPGGYYRHKNDISCEFTHISQRFLNIVGFTKEEIKEQFDNRFINMVHPDDRETILRSVNDAKRNGGLYTHTCRLRSKNGYIFVVNQKRLTKYEGFERFQGIILCDLQQYKWLGMDNDTISANDLLWQLMPCGIFVSEADDNHAFQYISGSMLSILGYTKEDFLKKFKNCTENMIYKEDIDRINREIFEQTQHSSFTSCEYRIEMADGSLKWFYSRGRLITDATGKRWFCTCITDYDFLKEKYQLPIQ